jgi:hypothetical protein
MSLPAPNIAFESDSWPTVERRTEPRSYTMLAHGKLTVSGNEQICGVCNISPQGMGVESRGLPQPGQRVRIEMRGLAPSPAVVIWRDPGKCGLAFEDEQNLDEVFWARGSRTQKKPRGPRFAFEVAAEVTFRVGISRFDTIDISADGLKLRGETHAQIGSYAVVRLDGYPDELSGYLAWKNDDLVGLHFERVLSREDLANILSYCR